MRGINWSEGRLALRVLATCGPHQLESPDAAGRRDETVAELLSLGAGGSRNLGFQPVGADATDLPGQPHSRGGASFGRRPAPSFKFEATVPRAATATVQRRGPVEPSIRPAGVSAASEGEKE
jgi:hypothetical protein